MPRYFRQLITADANILAYAHHKTLNGMILHIVHGKFGGKTGAIVNNLSLTCNDFVLSFHPIGFDTLWRTLYNEA